MRHRTWACLRGSCTWRLCPRPGGSADEPHVNVRGTRRACAVAMAMAVARWPWPWPWLWPSSGPFQEKHQEYTVPPSWPRRGTVFHFKLACPRLEPRGMIKASQTIAALPPAAVPGRMVWLCGHDIVHDVAARQCLIPPCARAGRHMPRSCAVADWRMARSPRPLFLSCLWLIRQKQ